MIVLADEAEAVVAELNASINQLEEKHTLFGGGIETVAFEHPGARKRSALAHTISAVGKVAAGVRAAREGVAVAFRAVIRCRRPNESRPKNQRSLNRTIIEIC